MEQWTIFFLLISFLLEGLLIKVARGRSLSNPKYRLISTQVFVDKSAIESFSVQVHDYNSNHENETVGDIHTFLTRLINSLFLSVNNILQQLNSYDVYLQVSLDNITFLTSDILSKRQQISSALNVFEDWLTANTFNKSYQHYFLFTGLSLGNFSGTSEVGQLCSKNVSSSIIQFHPPDFFFPLQVLLHELGHSLGAQHVIEDTTCNRSDQWVMLEGDGGFVFSNFTAQQIKTFVLEKGGCLTTHKKGMDRNGTDKTQVVGQWLNPDQLCQLVFGPNFFMTRPGLKICNELSCSTTTHPGRMFYIQQLDGLPCGSNKSCYLQECQASSNSQSQLSDRPTCPYGDSPHTAELPWVPGKTCKSVEDEATLCNNPLIRQFCCASCHLHSNG